MSSKYYRENGEILSCATGYIDPAVFSDRYPISCDKYECSIDRQDQFMEDSRVGICKFNILFQKICDEGENGV